jgi:hypothetical protein
VNYDHLKQTKTIIKPGILTLNESNPRLKDISFATSFNIVYDGNISGSAVLTFNKNPRQAYTKNELLVLSNFLKDIAETL